MAIMLRIMPVVFALCLLLPAWGCTMRGPAQPPAQGAAPAVNQPSARAADLETENAALSARLSELIAREATLNKRLGELQLENRQLSLQVKALAQAPAERDRYREQVSQLLVENLALRRQLEPATAPAPASQEAPATPASAPAASTAPAGPPASMPVDAIRW
jgi:TolA-binding protein